MKKAKIMLSAIGLLSIIGGALAFKAQHRNAPFFCTRIFNATGYINCSYTTTQGNFKLYCSTIADDSKTTYFTKVSCKL